MTDLNTKSHELIASDRVEGTAVRRPNGDKIGHIERLMIDKVTGKVSYAILSFGGFLGMGTNLLPLPWARLTYNTRFEAYQLDIDDVLQVVLVQAAEDDDVINPVQELRPEVVLHHVLQCFLHLGVVGHVLRLVTMM